MCDHVIMSSNWLKWLEYIEKKLKNFILVRARSFVCIIFVVADLSNLSKL